MFGKRKTIQKKLLKYQNEFYAEEPETISKFDQKKNGGREKVKHVPANIALPDDAESSSYDSDGSIERIKKHLEKLDEQGRLA